MGHGAAQKARLREIHQAGTEFLGVMDPEADASAAACRNTGARDRIRRLLEASFADARQPSFPSAAVVGKLEHSRDQVVLIDVATGGQQVLSPDQVVQRAAAKE